MDTLYTFWDNITHYRTESVHFLGLMNLATKYRVCAFGHRPWLFLGIGGEGCDFWVAPTPYITGLWSTIL